MGNSKPSSTAQHLRAFLGKLVVTEVILRRHQMQKDIGAAVGRHTNSDHFTFFHNGGPVDKTEILNQGFAIGCLHHNSGHLRKVLMALM